MKTIEMEIYTQCTCISYVLYDGCLGTVHRRISYLPRSLIIGARVNCRKAGISSCAHSRWDRGHCKTLDDYRLLLWLFSGHWTRDIAIMIYNCSGYIITVLYHNSLPIFHRHSWPILSVIRVVKFQRVFSLWGRNVEEGRTLTHHNSTSTGR